MAHHDNDPVFEEIELACGGSGHAFRLIETLTRTVRDYALHGWRKVGERIFVWYGQKEDAEWFKEYDLQGNFMSGYICDHVDGAESAEFERFVARKPLGKGFTAIDENE